MRVFYSPLLNCLSIEDAADFKFGGMMTFFHFLVSPLHVFISILRTFFFLLLVLINMCQF